MRFIKLYTAMNSMYCISLVTWQPIFKLWLTIIYTLVMFCQYEK